MTDTIQNTWQNRLHPSLVTDLCVSYHNRLFSIPRQQGASFILEVMLRIIMIAGSILVYPTMAVLAVWGCRSPRLIPPAADQTNGGQTDKPQTTATETNKVDPSPQPARQNTAPASSNSQPTQVHTAPITSQTTQTNSNQESPLKPQDLSEAIKQVSSASAQLATQTSVTTVTAPLPTFEDAWKKLDYRLIAPVAVIEFAGHAEVRVNNFFSVAKKGISEKIAGKQIKVTEPISVLFITPIENGDWEIQQYAGKLHEVDMGKPSTIMTVKRHELAEALKKCGTKEATAKSILERLKEVPLAAYNIDDSFKMQEYLTYVLDAVEESQGKKSKEGVTVVALQLISDSENHKSLYVQNSKCEFGLTKDKVLSDFRHLLQEVTPEDSLDITFDFLVITPKNSTFEFTYCSPSSFQSNKRTQEVDKSHLLTKEWVKKNNLGTPFTNSADPYKETFKSASETFQFQYEPSRIQEIQKALGWDEAVEASKKAAAAADDDVFDISDEDDV